MMKKLLLFVILVFAGMTQAVAQEYEYVPFVREGVKWVYYYNNKYPNESGLAQGLNYLTLELKGDTVINGKTYKAMHKYSGAAINMMNDTVAVYLREQDKVVYGIVPDGITYRDCVIGYDDLYTQEDGWMVYDTESIYERVRQGREFVLYDFNDTKNFYDSIFSDKASTGDYAHLYCDTVVLKDKPVLRHVIHHYNPSSFFIEGIGYDGFQSGYTLLYLYPQLMNEPSFHLSHVIENGDTIYKGVMFDQAFDFDSTDEYLWLTDEGVQWVNELVTVHNGDTTCSYYNYEFKYPDRIFYTNLTQDDGSDSLIAKADECIGFIRFYENDALAQVEAQGRNMINFACSGNSGVYLYLFPEKRDNVTAIQNYYIWHQKEPVFNSRNFIKVDPLTIEGVLCDRFAYIGENGDTLAYVVEGIGFDSYDMGDLLTPFTKRPDPNADYQEYCGLSHVVKDGKIIYKGMRYRHGAFTGIDEVEVADRTPRPVDPHYYNLMGQPVGTEVPTAPGIYIHNGNKIIVR